MAYEKTIPDILRGLSGKTFRIYTSRIRHDSASSDIPIEESYEYSSNNVEIAHVADDHVLLQSRGAQTEAVPFSAIVSVMFQ